MANRIGQQIGSYQLVRLLGGGGFAEVYLGQHVRVATQQAAIKILQLTNVDEQQFQQEAERTAGLRHPHIVQLYDFDIQEDIPFLVLQYAPNGSLARHRGQRLALNAIIYYVNQIAAALQYAHDSDVIHRDIKPDNILVGSQGELLVSDFGIAVISKTGRTSIQAGYNASGTPYYMAPEMFRGRPTRASDQYALGVMVYEWLSGRRPFSEGDFIQLGYQHTHELIPSLRVLVPSIPVDVENVVMVALAKEPQQRFASVRAFATALEQAGQMTYFSSGRQQPAQPSMQSQPPATSTLLPRPAILPVLPPSGPPSVTPPYSLNNSTRGRAAFSGVSTNGRATPKIPSKGDKKDFAPKRHLSRRKVIVGLSASIAALSIIGGCIVWYDMSQLAAGTTFFVYRGHSNTITSVAWSPDGKRVASASDDNSVQVWNAGDGSHAFTYTGHSATVDCVAWSPDGSRIASSGDDKTVQVWNAGDGSHAFTFTGHSDVVNAVAWSPDGNRIASGSGDMTVLIWDASDGNNVVIYQGHSDVVNAVAWSPDGKLIASGSKDRTVQVWGASDGNYAFTYKGHSDAVSTVVWSPDGIRIASGSIDTTVQVWNASDGSTPLIYHGHSNSVWSAAWSKDGSHIASGSGDATAQVWNASDGSNTYIYRGHSVGVNAVAWASDSKRIASGGTDTTVRVWEGA